MKGKDDLSMFILLPDQAATSLSDLENKLTSDDLINVREKFRMSSYEVNLCLPRFKLDEKISLSEMLAAMGMSDLFVPSVADLSGIDGSKELCVSQVVHRAVVEVNEEGTEAAGTTNVFLCSLCLDSFCANHPFLFFIQDKATRSILFLGRLVKPPAVELSDETKARRARAASRKAKDKTSCCNTH